MAHLYLPKEISEENFLPRKEKTEAISKQKDKCLLGIAVGSPLGFRAGSSASGLLLTLWLGQSEQLGFME